MPGESFYEGLLLPEAMLKMADHHAAPRTRHLSLFEYELLIEAARQLDAPLQERSPTIAEANVNWEALFQAYWTSISSPASEHSIELYSIPERVVAESSGLSELVAAVVIDDQATGGARRRIPATMASAQAVIAVLLVLAHDTTTDQPDALLELLTDHPARIEGVLSPEAFELANRALYQPSIPAEGSRPSFKSLQDLASAASGGAVGIANLPDIGYLGILKMGTAIIVTRVSLALGDRLSELVHEFKRPDAQTDRPAASGRGSKKRKG